MPVVAGRKTRFGPFELHSQTGELFKHGTRSSLHGQPIEVLALLLAHPGELVTREELRQHLWPEDIFVDFEHSLNTDIKKLRQALDDDADTPRYIETLPRKGYRFVAAVETVQNGADPVAAKAEDASAPAAALQAPEPPPPRRWRYAVATIVVLAVAAAAAWYWFVRPRTPVVTGIRQLTRTGRLKSLAGGYIPATDGTRVYFEEVRDDKWHIAQVSTKGGEVSYLDTPLLTMPWIAGISNDSSELLVEDMITSAVDSPFWVVPVPDGPPRRIPGSFALMAFVPGSNQIVYTHASDLKRLFIANRDGSEPRPLMSFPGDKVCCFFAISPDGKKTRFVTADNKMWESNLDGTDMHRFLPEHQEAVCCGNWSPDGKFFVFASLSHDGYNLWTITEPGWPRFQSVPRPVRLTYGPISFQLATLSKDGKQIFARGETLRGELSVYDAKSGEFRSYLGGMSAGSTSFSRDGQWITYVSHPQGTLWRSRIDGSNRIQLTFPPMGPVLNPQWSPDGRFIAFLEWGSHRKTYLVCADGGAPMLLLAGELEPADATWSPDGKSIAYGGGPSVSTPQARTEIRILDLDTKQTRTIPGSQGLFSPRWSPDGRYIAAQSDDQQRLYLYNFEGAGWKQLPLGGGCGWPTWSRDSRYLYVMSGSSIFKVTIPDGRSELAASVAGIDNLTPALPWTGWFGLTPDDRILIMRDRGVDEIYVLDLEYR